MPMSLWARAVQLYSHLLSFACYATMNNFLSCYTVTQNSLWNPRWDFARDGYKDAPTTYSVDEKWTVVALEFQWSKDDAKQECS